MNKNREILFAAQNLLKVATDLLITVTHEACEDDKVAERPMNPPFKNPSSGAENPARPGEWLCNSQLESEILKAHAEHKTGPTQDKRRFYPTREPRTHD